MSGVAQRLARLNELGFMLRNHVSGPRSLASLLSCYAAILTDPMTTDPVDLPLRHRGSRITLRMRKSDIFTVAELFHERQYHLARRLGPSPVIIDAGANVGVATAWFMMEYPDARILAIEPATSNYRFLESTYAGTPAVETARMALGDTDGTVTLHLAAHGAEHSTVGNDAAGSETVPCRRLDTLLAEHGMPKVDLLKLDVEGSEIAVLRGAGARLGDVRVIVGEVHETKIDVDEFYALLADADFEVVRRDYYADGKALGVHTMEAWRR